VNGSVKPLVSGYSEYVGVDLQQGVNVDRVMDAEDLVSVFGIESFDVVISTEALEHVLNWRVVIENIKAVLKPLGFLYLSVPNRDFGFHEYPYDCWRYSSESMAKVFSDMTVLFNKERDQGVLFKAQKPTVYHQVDLSDVALYSMLLQKDTVETPARKEYGH
jgi:SAM-dependent methyltransferase